MKREFCSRQVDVSDNKRKVIERAIAGVQAMITSAKETIVNLTKEIAGLIVGVHALDKAVADSNA